MLASFLLQCQTPQLPDDPLPDNSRFVNVTSVDPLLVDLICRRILCGPGQDLNIDLIIKDTSSDLLLNNGLSLLTLTMGVFVSHSATVEYQVSIDDLNLMSQGEFTVRDRLWFVLPFYAGLGSTNAGTFANTYRDPNHLQKYCLDERPGPIREFFDGSRDEICDEYERFLRIVLIELWPKISEMVDQLPVNPNLYRIQRGNL
mgnify:CR=1 FL=1